MAKKVILIDDTDGKPIDEGFEVAVNLSLNDEHWRLDLRQTNFEKLEAALKPFVDVAEKVENAPRRGRPAGGAKKSADAPTRSSASAGFSKEERASIRDWANRNGFTVGPRGAIKREVVDAYQEAHAS